MAKVHAVIAALAFSSSTSNILCKIAVLGRYFWFLWAPLLPGQRQVRNFRGARKQGTVPQEKSTSGVPIRIVFKTGRARPVAF